MTNQELRLTNKEIFGYFPNRIRSKELEIIRKKTNIELPLLSKMYFGLNIESERGCWINQDWTKYRVLNEKGTTINIHRLSFKIFRKIEIKGKFICHYCDRKGCSNPYHLFLGTRQDNIEDYKLKHRPERIVEKIIKPDGKIVYRVTEIKKVK